MEIKMVDLKSQYLKIKDSIDSSIQEVIDQSSFIKGPAVREFENELGGFLRVKNVVSCANGTDALQIAMMSLGLKPGDEVITASFTYVATAEVISLLGLTPVLVEVDPNTYLIDPRCIETAITPRTKAIVPIHLFGQCADMEPIMALAKRYDLFVIEDNAQALGASYTFSDGTVKMAGCIGHVGCTSFFPSKNLGCFGDGGALFTNDDDLAQRIRMIANHGQSKQYQHDIIGVNSRLDSIQAALLRVKLGYLDEYNLKRNQAAQFYDHSLRDIENLIVPTRAYKTTHVFHQYTVKLSTYSLREELRNYLLTNGIPSMVYYPVPLHNQIAFRNDRYPKGHFPITEGLCERVLSLPMHSELNEDQLEFICDVVLSFLKK
jgi:UDP-2-acetamido-2-deoxy-ribo-hexuluronate aminotransferase